MCLRRRRAPKGALGPVGACGSGAVLVLCPAAVKGITKGVKHNGKREEAGLSVGGCQR